MALPHGREASGPSRAGSDPYRQSLSAEIVGSSGLSVVIGGSRDRNVPLLKFQTFTRAWAFPIDRIREDLVEFGITGS